ncbi:MAG: co-chaperone GroES [Nitrosotalea sp.]
MIKPLYNNVLIKPLEEEATTKSGIYLPERMKEKPEKGLVVRVGPNVKTINKGDKVFYKKWTSNEIKDDKVYIVIKDEDILATY